MKLLRSILLILSATLTIAGCQSKEETTKPRKVIIAYVTSWTTVIPDTRYLTHINYAFGHVDDTFDGVRIDNEDRLRQIVALRDQDPGLKILLSIGGWGSGRFSEMAANEEYRLSFAKDCQRVVKEFKLDGIDIDWEYPTSNLAGISYSPDDTDNYTLLMRDIRQAIGTKKILTQATAANGKFMDFPALDAYIDFTNVMSYDMGNPPFHNSALYRSVNAGGNTTHEAVQKHLQNGVPRHKLVVGIPFYGRGIEGFPRPEDLTKAHETEGYTYHWDEVAKVPYLTDAEGNLVYGYENLESIAIKGQYIVDNDLKGAMFWEYNGDNENGDLLRTLYESLNK